MPFRRTTTPLTLEQASAYALRLLGQREYSQARLMQKLIDRGANPNDAKTVIEKCINMKLVDDYRFAQTIIRHEQDFRHQSQRAIYLKLLKKGIPKSIIEANLPKGDEIDHVRSWATKWIARHKSNSSKLKLMAFLYRKGFSGSTISAVLSELKSLLQ